MCKSILLVPARCLGHWVIAEKRLLWSSLLRVNTGRVTPPPGHGWSFVEGASAVLIGAEWA